MQDRAASLQRFWSADFEVPDHHTLHLALGPLDLWLADRGREWRVSTLAGDDALADRLEIGEPTTEPEVPEGASTQRFVTRRPGSILRLRPALADRPVVGRPEVPVTVPAGDEVDLFVGTPLWLRLELPDPPRPLLELPTTRPTDTWVGADTRSGQLGYASKTAARVNLDHLPVLPHWAVTRVTVRNEAADGLRLERLSVPAPSLGLYIAPNGRFWTRPIEATRKANGGPLAVELAKPAGDLEKVAEPREVTTARVLQRALHVFLG